MKIGVNHRYSSAYFDDYSEFTDFCNIARYHGWLLHSWQDKGETGLDVGDIDIRAMYVQDASETTKDFPFKAWMEKKAK